MELLELMARPEVDSPYIWIAYDRWSCAQVPGATGGNLLCGRGVCADFGFRPTGYAPVASTAGEAG